jgi:hypothetical protein
VRQRFGEPCDDGFANDVDGVNRVPLVVTIDRGHPVEALPLGCGHDLVPHISVQREDQIQHRVRVTHAGHAAQAIVDVGHGEQLRGLRLGLVSLRKLPPPISGPARYFNRCGLRSGG